ncbi:MAG: hypothetical protein ACRD6N_09970, partial [Pyrinomonadaceae bacterium]
SKERAELVAKANSKIRGRELRMLVAGFNDDWFGGFAGRGFSARSSGIWVFHPRAGCYTFLPFYMGWGSPYGSSYSNAFYGNYYWSGRSPYGYPNNGGGLTGGSVGNGAGGGSSAGNPPPAPPPPSPGPPPMATPREIPAAAERKIDRLSNPMP